MTLGSTRTGFLPPTQELEQCPAQCRSQILNPLMNIIPFHTCATEVREHIQVGTASKCQSEVR